MDGLSLYGDQEVSTAVAKSLNSKFTILPKLRVPYEHRCTSHGPICLYLRCISDVSIMYSDRRPEMVKLSRDRPLLHDCRCRCDADTLHTLSDPLEPPRHPIMPQMTSHQRRIIPHQPFWLSPLIIAAAVSRE